MASAQHRADAIFAKTVLDYLYKGRTMTDYRFWRLNSRPEGHEYAAALSLETAELPKVGDGQVLVQADYLSMDPGVRVWMTAREDS